MINELSNKCSIIVYPPSIYKYNVCAYTIIMPCFVGKDILIMSMNKNEINKNLPGKLSETFYITYHINDNLKNALNDDKKILIIDDIKLFRMMEIGSIITNNNKIKCKLVFIGSLGLISDDIEYIESMVDEKINYYKIPISDIGPIIDYKINISDNINLKIKKLITILLLKPGVGRHIIYTRDPDLLLDLCGDNLKEFKLSYIFITPDNSIEYQQENFKKWSDTVKSDIKYPLIMITSIIPKCNLFNVSDIHFIDQYDYFTYKSFVDRIYLKILYNHPIGKLTVHFHLNNNDIDNYKKLKKRLYDEQYTYSNLLTNTK